MTDAPDQTLTERFAAACAAFSYDRLPPSAQSAARLVLLDTLGAMLAGAQPTYPGTARLTRFIELEGTDGPCSIVGSHLRASPTNTALMNGYLAYALDIETLHGSSITHSAAAVIPASLALAQQQSSSGADLLASIVLGIDIACRVSLAIGPNDLYKRGYHPTSLAGTFGAAAAAALLLHQTSPQFERTLGLAATQTGGLLSWAADETEESRPFNPGLSARNGVTAAQLASLGFGAPLDTFDTDAKYSVFRTWSADGTGTPEKLLESFGTSFAIEELTYKQYACCAFLHPALDALFDIMQSEGVSASDIAAITMRFPRTGSPIIDNNPLRSHRAQYILPLAALRGEVLFDDVLVDRSNEPEVQRLSRATTFIQDDSLDHLYPQCYATDLTINTHQGERHNRRLDYARGTPQHPLDDTLIFDKFARLAATRIGAQQAAAVASQVMGLDQLTSIDGLLQSLTVSAR